MTQILYICYIIYIIILKELNNYSFTLFVIILQPFVHHWLVYDVRVYMWVYSYILRKEVLQILWNNNIKWSIWCVYVCVYSVGHDAMVVVGNIRTTISILCVCKCVCVLHVVYRNKKISINKMPNQKIIWPADFFKCVLCGNTKKS